MALLCLLLLCGSVCAAGTEIEELNTEVTVNEKGACLVTMTVRVDFSDAPQTFVIPLGSNVRDVELAGWSYRTRKLDGVTCLILRSEAGFAGEQTFVCSYRLPYAVSDSGSGQTFTLKLPEYGWAYGVSSYHLELTFPAEVSSAGRWSSGYYSDIFDNYLDIQVEGRTLMAQSNTPMRDSETVTLSLNFPEGTFDLRNQPGKTVAFDRIGFYALLVLAVVYWALRLRNPLSLPRAERTTNMEASAGEVACQLFGELPDVAALLAHWGNLGYLTIYRSGSGRILLYKQMEMGNERKPSERKLFYDMFRGGGACDAQSAHFRSVARSSGRAIRSAWIRRLFHRRSGNPLLLRLLGVLAGLLVGLIIFDRLLPANGARWFFLPLLGLLQAGLCALLQRGLLQLQHRRPLVPLAVAGGALLTLILLSGFGDCGGIMFLNLLLQGFCALGTLFGGRRSAEGRERLSHLLGLRKFLRRADRSQLQELTRYDSQYFYRMLPYADAMGVGRAFASGFGDWRPEPCAWLTDARRQPGTAREFQALYDEILTSIRTGSSPVQRRPAAPAGRRR